MQITTIQQLDALPDGAVVMSGDVNNGGEAYQAVNWWINTNDKPSLTRGWKAPYDSADSQEMIDDLRPLTLIHPLQFDAEDIERAAIEFHESANDDPERDLPEIEWKKLHVETRELLTEHLSAAFTTIGKVVK